MKEETKKKLFFKFECGCEYLAADAKKISGMGYVCPKHLQFVSERFMICGCGARVVSEGAVGVPKRLCSKCLARSLKVRNSVAYKNRSKNNVKGVYLEFKCGCIKKREDSIYKAIDGEKGWCCPEHKEVAIRRFIFCEVCGKETDVSLKGKPKIMCPGCAAAKKKRTKKKQYVKLAKIKKAAVKKCVPKKPAVKKPAVKKPVVNKIQNLKPTPSMLKIKAIEASQDCSDCKHRSECLMDAGMKNVLPCLGCTHYESDMVGADAMAGGYKHGTESRIFA